MPFLIGTQKDFTGSRCYFGIVDLKVILSQ